MKARKSNIGLSDDSFLAICDITETVITALVMLARLIHHSLLSDG